MSKKQNKDGKTICYFCNEEPVTVGNFLFEGKYFCCFICLEKFVNRKLKNLVDNFIPNTSLLKIRDELIKFGQFLHELERAAGKYDKPDGGK